MLGGSGGFVWDVIISPKSVLFMQVNFYTSVGCPLWDGMKHNICDDILNNLSGENSSKYNIHFDKMLFKIGWFIGFVEIWKGRRLQRNKRKIPFIAHITDWGKHGDCRNRPNYRVTYTQNPFYINRNEKL
jgi:hypothetical protein